MASLEVPDAVLNAIAIPGPMDQNFSATPAGVQRDTFSVFRYEEQLAAGGTAGGTICTLGRGVWRISITGQMTSNADSVQSVEPDATVTITRPLGQSLFLFALNQGTDSMPPATREITLSLPDDLSTLVDAYSNPATTYRAWFTMYFAKLL
jgi:hypothetical protein